MSRFEGHSNRITCVRFWPFNPDIVVSAGFDGTCMAWDQTGQTKDQCGEDVNRGEPFQILSDLDVRGDSLDFDNDKILAGSWRPMNQLQIYDLRSGKMEKTIGWRVRRQTVETYGQVPQKGKMRWNIVKDAVRGSCNVYAAQYIAGGAFLGGIVAGGTGNKELKVIRKASPHATFQTNCTILAPRSPVHHAQLY